MKIKMKIENLLRDTDDTNLKIIMLLIHVHESPSPIHKIIHQNAMICCSATKKK